MMGLLLHQNMLLYNSAPNTPPRFLPPLNPDAINLPRQSPEKRCSASLLAFLPLSYNSTLSLSWSRLVFFKLSHLTFIVQH